MTRKSWLPEIAALLVVAAIAGLVVDSFNSGDIESAQGREDACVSGAKSMQIEIDQTKKSLQSAVEEKNAAEYRLTEAESHTRELKRQLDDMQAMKDTLGEIVDAVKGSKKRPRLESCHLQLVLSRSLRKQCQFHPSLNQQRKVRQRLRAMRKEWSRR